MNESKLAHSLRSGIRVLPKVTNIVGQPSQADHTRRKSSTSGGGKRGKKKEKTTLHPKMLHFSSQRRPNTLIRSTLYLRLSSPQKQVAGIDIIQPLSLLQPLTLPVFWYRAHKNWQTRAIRLPLIPMMACVWSVRSINCEVWLDEGWRQRVGEESLCMTTMNIKSLALEWRRQELSYCRHCKSVKWSITFRGSSTSFNFPCYKLCVFFWRRNVYFVWLSAHSPLTCAVFFYDS